MEDKSSDSLSWENDEGCNGMEEIESENNYVEKNLVVGELGDNCEHVIDREVTLDNSCMSDDNLKPYIGLKFDSKEEAYEFYNSYAKRVGFSVRRGGIRKSRKDNSIISCRFFCSKEGFREERYKKDAANKKRHHRETRTGCGARIYVNKSEDGAWAISFFEENHNHQCVAPTKCCLLPSHRNVSDREVTLDNSCMVDENLKPYIGLKFDSNEKAYEFYNSYAKRVGFSVRRGGIRKSIKDNSIISCRFFCSKEGFREEKYKKDAASKQRRHTETRTGCRARIYVNKSEDGAWAISFFEENHNHECVTPKQPSHRNVSDGQEAISFFEKNHNHECVTPKQPSHRNVSDGQGVMIERMAEAGIRTNLMMHYPSEEVQGRRNVDSYTKIKYSKPLETKTKLTEKRPLEPDCTDEPIIMQISLNHKNEQQVVSDPLKESESESYKGKRAFEPEDNVMKRAEKVIANLPPGCPLCIWTYCPSYLKGGNMVLSTRFCDDHLSNLEHKRTLTLVDEHGKAYYLFDFDVRLRFMGGSEWTRFLKENKLCKGDVLVFQLIDTKHLKLKVYIVRQNVLGGADGTHDLKLSGSAFDISEFERFEDFTILINGINLDSKISETLKRKYYELCCSQRSYLHQHLLEDFNDCAWVENMISKIVQIADDIRGSKISTPSSYYKSRIIILESFEKLGMNVGFLCDLLKCLMSISSNEEVTQTLKGQEDDQLELSEVEDNIRSLGLEITKWRQKKQEIFAKMQKRKPIIEGHEQELEKAKAALKRTP